MSIQYDLIITTDVFLMTLALASFIMRLKFVALRVKSFALALKVKSLALASVSLTPHCLVLFFSYTFNVINILSCIAC